jgi:hypothetical protein
MYINIYMYINQIDELFNNILNNFFEFINKQKFFTKLTSDVNFILYQNDILLIIKDFINTISTKEILDLIKKENNLEFILNIIKRYCAYYIYLGIAYYYQGGRDLYVTNIIEISRNQKDNIYQITNFFNSYNNSKIISFYNDIKNILGLLQLKTIDKIKIILSNNPLKYDSTIKLFNEFGEDYIVEYFLIKDNLHNILKSLIFKQIYLKEEKIEIINILNQIESNNTEYKYIEIIVSNERKLVDFNFIQKFLNIDQLRSGLAEEIYNYLEENRDSKEFIIKENKDFINYLFSNKIIIPITEDFLRYHKDTEKYLNESNTDLNIKDREVTKIKYIVNKINNVKKFYSSILDKNPKIKLDIDKLFFKALDPKMAVLYNEIEELKIIQKLELSKNATDGDLLIDLENIRKYSYINFKDLSKDGIKIRPSNIISGIRSTNLKIKNKSFIETRIGHTNIDMNVIGIALNLNKIPLNDIRCNNLINISEHFNESNSFKSLLNIMNKNKKTNKIYYWLFDNSKDKPLQDLYINYNINDPTNNINIMLEQLYKNYIKIIKNKFENDINKAEDLTTWYYYNLNKYYTKNYFNLNLNPEIKNELIEIAFNQIKELEVIEDDVDSYIPGRQSEIIKLPVIKINKKNYQIIELNSKKIDIQIDLPGKNIPICNHYIKWKNINKLSKKSDEFNQAVFEFVKQYVKENNQGDKICKSCNEMIQMQRFIIDGTYNKEADMFLTTSLEVNLNLEEIPKYKKYMRTIKNLNKNVENIAHATDLTQYLGNDMVIKLRRKLIVKDVIDLILIHSEWLKNNSKNRNEDYSKRYNINKDLTNLFFFELKDDIFLTSSTETDYYKIIKYNNIIIYLVFIILFELNTGQIINLKNDKKYNYFFFDKIKNILFENLYLRKNQKEKILLIKIPLFSYLIYYISGILVSKKIWLYNNNNDQNKDLLEVNIQKSIIHTLIDLINSIIEANFEDNNKNYLYEIIVNKLNIKYKYIFDDNSLLQKIHENTMKNIKYDSNTQKVTLLTKKINYIELNINYLIEYNIKNVCNFVTTNINIIDIKKDNNNINLLTNCLSGTFHKWEFKKNDLICKLCNKSYNEIIDFIKNKPITNHEQNLYLDKIKFYNLNKSFKKYCISGAIHEFENNSKCIHCGLDINYKPTEKELKLLESNLNKNKLEIIKKNINNLKTHNENIIKNENNNKLIITNIINKYDEFKLDYYISDFIDRLIKILGAKIKINDNLSNYKNIYLKDTIYILDHDYLGNKISQDIIILSSEDKILLINNHPSFNKDILYYKDKSNNMYVYYDPISYQYIGYSDDNKNIKRNKNNASLKIEFSVKECINYLGYENKFINIYHINKDYQNISFKEINKNSYDIILNIIRTRILNLKQIINKINNIIYNIRNNGTINSIYNKNEKEIINEFTKKLKKFNIKNNDNIIFNNYKLILNKLILNYNIPTNINLELNNNYIDIQYILLKYKINNNDNYLLFYLIYNFNLLLDYNINSSIESEIAYLIIKLIRYSFNFYYKPYYNYNIRQFDYYLLNDVPYIEDYLKGVGYYQELLTKEEIDNPDKKEQLITDNEELNALDIDDYDVDDDIDGNAEALDGFDD